jgi:hypothetical protein
MKMPSWNRSPGPILYAGALLWGGPTVPGMSYLGPGVSPLLEGRILSALGKDCGLWGWSVKEMGVYLGPGDCVPRLACLESSALMNLFSCIGLPNENPFLVGDAFLVA